jgi:hypothetical protein
LSVGIVRFRRRDDTVVELTVDQDLADDLQSESAWFPLTIEVEGDASDAVQLLAV